MRRRWHARFVQVHT
ncbi:unnamed protein product [Victoria cruziana]